MDAYALTPAPPEAASAASRDESVRVSGLCRFARTVGISEEIAIVIYRCELQRLNTNAKVTLFVPLLAERAAREILRARAGEARGRPMLTTRTRTPVVV